MNKLRQNRPPKRAVNGVLLFDKPSGASSNGALQSVRRLYRALKAGHTGTLDPMATGLMVLAFGEATKFSQNLLDADKSYEAVVKLGIETDTGDADGSVVASQPACCAASDIQRVAGSFVGCIEQLPPMYSALKRDGKPLYEYARAGIELERPTRPVTIHTLEVFDCYPDRFSMRVDCSKGTYIRTLAMDIGRALGCGAHLAALRRTRIARFSLSDALTLAELELLTEQERDIRLSPVDALVSGFPVLNVDETGEERLLHGQALSGFSGAGQVRLYGPLRGFIGLGEFDDASVLRPRRLLNSADAKVV